jgi:hypothetical protein
MINFVCCTVVVDNCDHTSEDLEGMIVLAMSQESYPYSADVKVKDGYFPKQRVIVVPSAEHVKQVILALYKINEEIARAQL